MSPAAVVGAVLWWLGGAPAGLQDTALTVRGFVQSAGQEWRLFLQEPVAYGGARWSSLGLAPEGSWSRYAEQFVEATGMVRVSTGVATLADARVKNVTAPGTAKRTVTTSFTQRAVVTLAIIPQRIRWRDADGRSSGVRPAVFYTLTNHGQTHLEIFHSTKDVLCLAVRRHRAGEAHWRQTWRPEVVGDRLTVSLGATVRYLAPFPEAAAPTAGRYILRAALCGEAEYGAEAEFEVVG
ncbi:MAG: hypothetical protein ACREL9_02930 [Gemmatimonadales bacterium]